MVVNLYVHSNSDPRNAASSSLPLSVFCSRNPLSADQSSPSLTEMLNRKMPKGKVVMAEGSVLCHRRGPCALLEVLSVRNLAFDGDKEKEINGTIEVWDDQKNNKYVIFDRPEQHPQLLRPLSSDLLTLTGPREEAIDGSNAVYIQCKLFDKQDSECFLPFYLSKFKGWQDSRDFLSKDLFLDQDEPGGYDKILRKEFITDSGLWEVKFVPYSHALKATVRLSLANWKAREGSKQAAKICGKVVASNNLLRECAKTVLFNLCPHDEPLTVSVNQTVGENELIIPLLRPIVVVPYASIFKVAVNIWLHPDDDDYDANNFTIVNNAVFFPAELSGEVQQSISGELGDIQVTVAWSHRISVTYCLF